LNEGEGVVRRICWRSECTSDYGEENNGFAKIYQRRLSHCCEIRQENVGNQLVFSTR